MNPGDVVQLKSGGPKMTIDSVGELDYSGLPKARCVWFIGNELKDAIFSIESLVKI